MSAGENSIANCWVADTVADFRGSYRIVRSALAPRRAEVARACGEIGALMIVGADAMLSIEEVAAAGNEPKWLQVFLYMVGASRRAPSIACRRSAKKRFALLSTARGWTS